MSDPWFTPLNEAFDLIVSERKGRMVRRAGVLSAETEVLFQHGSWPALVGFDLTAPGGPQLSLYVRTARMPAAPGVSVDFVGLPALMPEGGPPAVVGPHKPATSHPGFHLHYHRPSHFVDEWLQRLIGPAVKTDRARPGWIHVSSCHRLHIQERLESALADAFGTMVAGNDPEDLTVILTPFVFRVRQKPVPMDTVLLMSFLEDGLRLLDAVLELHPPPELDLDEIAELPAVVEVHAGWCGICGEEANQRRVACARCRSPHHKECWGWIGQCALFGCGSRRFVE